MSPERPEPGSVSVTDGLQPPALGLATGGIPMSISEAEGDLHSISESQFPYLSNGVLIHLFLGC